jgi:hypothetical protein
MAKPQNVTFVVGGEKFELSRSLLAMYPETMLSTSASERWHTDPESEIIMDRDPMLFHHVLAYLRDKKVYLPTTVAKKAVLSELEYYCVDDVDEDGIDDSLTQGYLAAQGAEKMQVAIEEFDEEFREGVKQANAVLAAKQCIERFLALRGIEKELEITGFTGFQHPKEFYPTSCNKSLEKVGLKMLCPDKNAHRFIVTRIKTNEKEIQDTNKSKKRKSLSVSCAHHDELRGNLQSGRVLKPTWEFVF